MQRITVLCMGKLKEPYWQAACMEYQKRLGRFCRLQIIEIPTFSLPEQPNQAQIGQALQKEAERILDRIPQGSRVYALCVEGSTVSSEDLQQEIRTAALSGSADMCFLIGSSHGLAEEVKQMAQKRISMSRMTFPHQLARVMLLEQLYRAFMLEGGRYHK